LRAIDRALATVGQTSALRVLLSEIIIPAPPQRAAAVLAQAERISQLRSEAEFSAAARRFSATASRFLRRHRVVVVGGSSGRP